MFNRVDAVRHLFAQINEMSEQAMDGAVRLCLDLIGGGGVHPSIVDITGGSIGLVNGVRRKGVATLQAFR